MATISTATVTLSLSASGREARGTATPLSVVSVLDANGAVLGKTLSGPDGSWSLFFPASVAGQASSVSAQPMGSSDSYAPPPPPGAGAAPPGPAGLAMTQLTAGRVYQRATVTGGLAGKGVGAVTVPITLTAAASIDYRLRDAVASNNPVVQDWTSAGTNVPASATSVTCPGVPADAKQYLLDLRANADGAQIVLGTAPVMMGRVIAISGQSQAVRQITKISTYTGTNASLGVTISPYTGVYATYSDGSATGGGTAAWAPPADNSNYASTFASEFLRRQVGATGVACALVGHAVGSTAIAAWAPGTANNVQLRSILDAVGGFEVFYWHQGGDDAGAGTTKAAYKTALDALFADLTAHNAARGTNYTKVLTAMATRLAGAAGTTAAVTAIRQAHKEWAATNGGIYVEPHDLNLEDTVHQGQPGNIVLAQHIHRALATTDVGPSFGTPTRAAGSAVINVPITFPAGSTALVLTGSPASRLSVFPAGTQTNGLAISTVTYDSANTRLVITLASTPADNVALDVYAFLHPDPSGTAANSDMIRGDRVDGDGITVGRSLEPSTTAPVTVAAPVPGSGTAPAPAVGDVIRINTYDSRAGGASAPANLTGWNDLDQSTATSAAPKALVNSTGAATPLTGYITTGLNSGNSQNTAATATGAYPKAILDSFVFIDKANTAGNGTSTQGKLAILGLVPGTVWTLRMTGYRINVTNRQETFSGVGTATQTANAEVGSASNGAVSVSFSLTVPASGELDGLIAQVSAENFAYLNGADLTRTA